MNYQFLHSKLSAPVNVPKKKSVYKYQIVKLNKDLNKLYKQRNKFADRAAKISLLNIQEKESFIKCYESYANKINKVIIKTEKELELLQKQLNNQLTI